MGNLFKPITTKPVPAGAEVVEREGTRTARWRNRQGKICTAPVRTTALGDRIAIESTKYVARFRDGAGVVQTVSTGCRDLIPARAVLAELERRSELVRSGVLTAVEDGMAGHRRTSIVQHLEACVSSLRTKGRSPEHCEAMQRLVSAIITACSFRTIADVKREPVERWLAAPENASRSARTRNSYLGAMKLFLNWCVDTERLAGNPLARIQPADERVDRRRVPRALTEEELVRLLDAARRRPLVEALTLNWGSRKGKPGAQPRPETRAKLERLGRERALIYKTLVLTGLRVGELAEIRVCDVVLDGPRSHIVLDAKHEKNRQGSTIPLRADLATDLRHWIGGGRDGLLFGVSASLIKVLDRDLKFAGIAKHDDRGRTVCVHSLRHTFATLLSRGGVAPRTAQAAMRHSTIDLTMRVYTDPRLLDVVGALNALPELPLTCALAVTAATSA